MALSKKDQGQWDSERKINLLSYSLDPNRRQSAPENLGPAFEKPLEIKFNNFPSYSTQQREDDENNMVCDYDLSDDCWQIPSNINFNRVFQIIYYIFESA